jgi:UDP-2-acetamido-2,6-beta-L-arabino-hexul-4-ose reductase
MGSPIVLSGGSGFLGWHTRVLARALGLPRPTELARADFTTPARLAGLLDGADRVLHVAGVNRGTPAEVKDGNEKAAEALATAIQQCATPPKTVVFANSTQAGNGTPYGDSKAAAAQTLEDATRLRTGRSTSCTSTTPHGRCSAGTAPTSFRPKERWSTSPRR